MNITQIQYFLAVAENKSLSAAANLLFVTQPALSIQISRLESELDVQLFVRSPNGMLLTEAGVEFCKYAGNVIDSWHHMLDNVENLDRFTPGVLRIWLGPRVYSNNLLAPIISFFDMHPEISVSFPAVRNDDPLESLRSGKIDIALDRFPPLNLVPDHPRFVSYELIKEPYCVLAAKNNPISKRSSYQFSELNGQPFIAGLPETMSYKIHHRDFAIANVKVKRAISASSIDVNMKLVQMDKGISVGPLSFADYYDICAIPFQPEINVALKLFYLRSNCSNQKI